MKSEVAKALEEIPSRRDALNMLDDELARAIKTVESALTELKIGVPVETYYTTSDGRYVLMFCKWGGTWQIVHGSEADDETKDTALSHAPRHVRAEAFVERAESGLAPIEELVVAAASALVTYAVERSPQVAVARRLVAVLEAAGLGRATAA